MSHTLIKIWAFGKGDYGQAYKVHAMGVIENII